MIPKLSLFLFFLSVSQVTFSQSTIINSIEFSGLKKTKTSYLERLIDTQEGTIFNRTQVEKDVQQLKNMIQVAYATYEIDSTTQGINLTYKIEEALTLFPIVNFGGVRGNIWFQLGATDANWLGLGHQLTAYYQNNDNRSGGNIYYRLPYIGGSKWGTSLSILKWASVEPLYFPEGEVTYKYDQISISSTAIYEFKRQNTLEFGGTYFVEDYAKSEEQILENPPGPDALRQPKLLGKIVHSLSRINYHYFYREGFSNVLNLQTVYNFSDETQFNILINETQFYRRIKNSGNLAARLRFGISTNNNTPFAPFVLDSHLNIRGAGNRIDRGTAAFILNVEYRQTIYDKNYWAAQIVGFSDFGTWRNPGGSLEELKSRDNFRHFVGGGFRLIYKKAHNAVLRVDYGVDIYDIEQQGLVIGLGQYF